MQKYILGADPNTQCAIIRPFDDNGNVAGENLFMPIAWEGSQETGVRRDE